MIFQTAVSSSELQVVRAYTILAAQRAGGTPSITGPLTHPTLTHTATPKTC